MPKLWLLFGVFICRCKEDREDPCSGRSICKFPYIRGPQDRPPNIIILVTGAKKTSPLLENTLTLSGTMGTCSYVLTGTDKGLSLGVIDGIWRDIDICALLL